ncbi:hypothetical protein WDZ92_31360, partial [Nostoc sp. NIES-2111]
MIPTGKVRFAAAMIMGLGGSLPFANWALAQSPPGPSQDQGAGVEKGPAAEEADSTRDDEMFSGMGGPGAMRGRCANGAMSAEKRARGAGGMRGGRQGARSVPSGGGTFAVRPGGNPLVIRRA